MDPEEVELLASGWPLDRSELEQSLKDSGQRRSFLRFLRPHQWTDNSGDDHPGVVFDVFRLNRCPDYSSWPASVQAGNHKSAFSVVMASFLGALPGYLCSFPGA